MTAALAMLGVGQTTLRGTVFDFNDWPHAATPLVSEIAMPAAAEGSPVLSGPRVMGSRVAGVRGGEPGGLLALGGIRSGAGTGGGITIRVEGDSAEVASSSGSPGRFDAARPEPVRGDRPVGAPVAVDADGDGVSESWRQGRTGEAAPAAGPEETGTTIFSVEPPRLIEPAPAVTPPVEEPVAPPVEEPAPPVEPGAPG
jgi:hypothetical protein